MIQVLMFDLGMTLSDGNNRPFPHVADALKSIAKLKTTAGKPLKSCLVSDFTMPSPGHTVSQIFAEYLAILDTTTLRPFFEPVKKRVTLSTHAGVMKPDRKVFQKALDRLGSQAALKNCLFITENSDHVKVVRSKLHMQALQFGKDFNDWSQASAIIAHIIASP